MARARDLESQIHQLEEQIQSLREEVEKQHQDSSDLLVYLDEPRSFSQLITATGENERALIARLHGLEKAGKVERWDLPRWILSEIPERDKIGLILAETPLRQQDLEILLRRRRGPVSGQITQLQRVEGLIKLGDGKGDPWFLPTGGRGARGTRDIATDAKGAGGSGDGTRYQLHRSRRGRSSEGPPTRGPRPPKGET